MSGRRCAGLDLAPRGRIRTLALAAAILLPANPASADDTITRRLAALSALVRAERSVLSGRSAPPATGPATVGSTGRATVGSTGRATVGSTGPATARSAGRSALPEDLRCDPAWWRAGSLRTRMAEAVRDAAIRFGVDRSLLWSVIRVESNYDPDAVSSKGAMGLMQLMPATARFLGVACPFDPRENVIGGARYLRLLRDRLGGWRDAVAAYHAGPGAVVAERLGPETRRYVERVLALWRGGAAGLPPQR